MADTVRGVTDASTPLLSPLHDRHLALGAKLGDFGGWSMPLEYAGGGVVAEHTAVRERVGVFDVSHLGKASVTGPGAAALLDSVLTNSLDRIGPGKAQYTLLCDENGGVVDDLIAYLHEPDDVFLIPNASNTAEVVRILAAAAPEGITVTNLHHEHGVLAVQGPRSAALLDALGLQSDLEYMAFVPASLDGVDLLVCRTGYTGEHGYELVVPWSAAGAVWDAILAAGAGDDEWARGPVGSGQTSTTGAHCGLGDDDGGRRLAAALVIGTAAGLLAGYLVVRRARARFGGITGDVLGATAEITFTVVLLSLALLP